MRPDVETDLLMTNPLDAVRRKALGNERCYDSNSRSAKKLAKTGGVVGAFS
jgi:hypothetical protein